MNLFFRKMYFFQKQFFSLFPEIEKKMNSTTLEAKCSTSKCDHEKPIQEIQIYLSLNKMEHIRMQRIFYSEIKNLYNAVLYLKSKFFTINNIYIENFYNNLQKFTSANKIFELLLFMSNSIEDFYTVYKFEPPLSFQKLQSFKKCKEIHNLFWSQSIPSKDELLNNYFYIIFNDYATHHIFSYKNIKFSDIYEYNIFSYHSVCENNNIQYCNLAQLTKHLHFVWK